ncbi:hypothetical protein [Nocardioides sp. CFH 31398]|uniref:hypothetical protein n=1 Tax=Nocardioides sp. CFH 31398 TaxID=2919579 RepID=UPI001F05FC04|nr:hypothetical protein [Nocardioides sp. CFH 31398]MCH1865618.1 hypothetical protein [Nocardioides sp. CFH 31398]
MTARDDALLDPVAVARVEDRARATWTVCGVGVALLVSLVGFAYGLAWPAVLVAVCLAAVVAGAWAWLRTARTLRAAGDRVREASQGKQSRVRRWSRAVRDGRFDEVDPDEAADMVRSAEAAAVRARLAPYGLGGLWLAVATTQLVNLALNPPPFADGPVAQVLAVALVVGLFGTAGVLHRRDRLRLENFLRDLDEPGRRP